MKTIGFGIGLSVWGWIELLRISDRFVGIFNWTGCIDEDY